MRTSTRRAHERYGGGKLPYLRSCNDTLWDRDARAATNIQFPAGRALKAPIWKAARATSAAPTYFIPIDIDGIDYGDAGIGYNNPAKEALAEAHNMWPNHPIGCLLSIGTGLGNALQRPDEAESANLARLLLKRTSPKTAFKLAVAEYCVKCSTSCELVHQEIADWPRLLVKQINLSFSASA